MSDNPLSYSSAATARADGPTRPWWVGVSLAAAACTPCVWVAAAAGRLPGGAAALVAALFVLPLVGIVGGVVAVCRGEGRPLAVAAAVVNVVAAVVNFVFAAMVGIRASGL